MSWLISYYCVQLGHSKITYMCPKCLIATFQNYIIVILWCQTMNGNTRPKIPLVPSPLSYFTPFNAWVDFAFNEMNACSSGQYEFTPQQTKGWSIDLTHKSHTLLSFFRMWTWFKVNMFWNYIIVSIISLGCTSHFGIVINVTMLKSYIYLWKNTYKV